MADVMEPKESNKHLHLTRLKGLREVLSFLIVDVMEPKESLFQEVTQRHSDCNSSKTSIISCSKCCIVTSYFLNGDKTMRR